MTVFDILFNKIKLLGIDFFDIVEGDDSLVNRFRLNVAAWYYIMRNISAAILLVILIYIGIRMAISTIASDRALYKRMLADWAVSLVLIFVLNYIIVFTVNVNNAIVDALSHGLTSSGESSTSQNLESVMGQFGWKGMNPFGGISSIIAAVIYIMLIWQTAAMFFSYFNRMLKIAFLIIISPLISLTYSIDKIGDGKAQALDAWLKEFVFTILMQPFHCAIYMSLISTAVNVLIGLGGFNHLSQTIGASILSIICITFTKEAEKIIRKIFAFKDDNKKTSLVAGVAVASMVMNKTKDVGTGAVKFGRGAKDFITKDGKEAITNFKTDTIAAVRYLSKKNDPESGGEGKDYATLQAEERAKAYEAKASKLESSYYQAEKMKVGSNKLITEAVREKTIEEERQKLLDETEGTMDPRELNAKARLNAARRLTKGRGSGGKNEGTGNQSSGSSLPLSSNVENTPATPASSEIPETENNSDSKTDTPTSEETKKGSDSGAFSELRSLVREDAKGMIGKSVRRGAGLFMGAGTYGLKGSLATSVATGVGTYKVVEQAQKSLKGSYKRDIKRLASGIKNENRDSIDAVEVMKKVSANPADYNLADGKASDRLKEIIEELKKEVGAGNMPSEGSIVNTITQNSKNPSKALGNLFAGKGLPSNSQALRNLQNFGNEYAISQAMGEASKVGLSTGDLIRSSRGRGEALPTFDSVEAAKYLGLRDYSEERTTNIKDSKTGEVVKVDLDAGAIASRNARLANEFISNPNESVLPEVAAVPQDQMLGVYQELGKVIRQREAIQSTIATLDEEFKRKSDELEAKRAELIKAAVESIDVINNSDLEVLQMKISGAAKQVIEEFNNSTGTEDDRKKTIEKLEYLLRELK